MPFSLTGLCIALILPWCLGCIWVHCLLRGSRRSNVFVVLGQGYFLGTFVTTLVIRLWDMLGFQLSFWKLAVLLLAVCGCGLLLQRWSRVSALPHTYAAPTPRWHLLIGSLLLALIAWRQVTLVQELLLRPLYAWDAWMNWAPKAIVWFYHGSLVEFVNSHNWIWGDPNAYTLGNRQASSYPITVPLIQLWTMLGAGTWDSSAVFLPWIISPIALGLGLFGHLRLARVPFLPALTACYLLLSLPYLNVHSVLAGYADIWLAAAFCMAVCALYEAQRTRHWGYALLCLLLAWLCADLKNPGVVLAAIVLLFAIRIWLNLKPALELLLWVVSAVVVISALIWGFSFDVPYLGHIAFEHGMIEVGKFGQFEIAYHAVGNAFLETFFVMINWHLLWYLLVPAACFSFYRWSVLRKPSAEVLPVVAALAFVFVVFVFSRHYIAALNFVTLNRALLYPVPALIFCMFLWFQQPDRSVGEYTITFR
ncbi:MAG: hypothetical protein R3E64_04675 [Halioglobus sp.]